MTTTPRAAGFHMPAEWTPHAGCYMAWPVREALWGDGIEAARDAYAAVASAISRFEPLTMLVCPDLMANARERLPASVKVEEMSQDDSWARDFLPTFLVDGAGKVAGADWQFNCWGKKFPDYAEDAKVAERLLDRLGARRFAAPFVLEGGAIHVDGEGTILTSEECLLHPNRNPGLSKAEIEAHLKEWLGGDTVLWLGQGYEDDDTDGHIDEIACFAAPGKVLINDCQDPADINYARFQDNIRRLELAKDAKGRQIEIIRLPQPTLRTHDGVRLTLSYTNFYIANGGVVMSAFDDPADAKAKDIIARCFPDREIVQLPALAITRGGGGIHCITQQLPKGEIAR
ncbi:agmatine/peptidylarginine deiminase [Lacibacterium aquatile]|uniref:Putative agmatine deiminase n=1 Tax=Lacibacterium aquatile TaxID=1168082 RepID=A0ABW5DSX3_9PROT